MKKLGNKNVPNVQTNIEKTYQAEKQHKQSTNDIIAKLRKEVKQLRIVQIQKDKVINELKTRASHKRVYELEQ